MKPFEFIPNRAQAEFLASSADVRMIGGNAGGGKSLVAIMELLGLNEPRGPRYTLPYYRGLIFRKRRGDLVDLIDKSKKIYPLVDPGATFNNQDSFWKFSSGAILYFKYFDRFDTAETWLQGQELQTVCAEEAGQMEDDRIFLYCQSRLRSPDGLKCYMTATCNPSRYPWLREYFQIDAVGTSTDFTREFVLEDGTVIKKRIQFIRAKLQDNKHIGKEYQAGLMMQSEENRKALLDGDWTAYDTVEGQIYQYELAKMKAENRHALVPYDPALPVYTYWDIGISDLGIVLFVQFMGKEIRVIDMLKNNNVSIQSYYIPQILARKQDRGYQYGGHYLPHDAGSREKFGGESIIDQVRKYLQDVHQLPRLDLAVGLEKSRQMFASVWIDSRTELHADLVNYRREWDESMLMYSQRPVHDKFSHSADAFRYIAYAQPKSIRPDHKRFMRSGDTNPFSNR